MIGIYKPTKIVEVRLQVEEEHTKVARGKAKKDDEVLKELIYRIVRMKKESVIQFAETLSERQIHQISEYVCLNFWNVKLANLFEVMYVRAGIEEWDTIYSGWLNRYDRKPDGDIIRKSIGNAITNCEKFQAYIRSKNWKIRNLMWLTEADFYKVLCSECIKKSYRYSEELIEHGVGEETALYNCCMMIFYQICDRKALLSEGAEKLKELYLIWIKPDKEKFCVNVYEKLDIEDLSAMKSVLYALDNDFKEPDLKKILSPRGYRLYLAWRNVCIIETAIAGTDDWDRRTFWMHYAANNKFLLFKHSLVIDFGKYVAVEFRRKSKGPTYIYTKDYYQRVVRPEVASLSESNLRDWEKKQYDASPPGILERLVHLPPDSWQYKFRVALRKYGIFESRLQ